MTGAWQEAFVEAEEDDFYRIRDALGLRRWIMAGEVAWHDLAPQPFDLAAGKALIAWDERQGGRFQPAVLLREEVARGTANGGGVWAARFDDGTEASVPVSRLRDRWHSPLRVLCLWGNYHPAIILECLMGLLRLDFGGGLVRWSLPEQTLDPAAPDPSELVPGTYVAVRQHQTLPDGTVASAQPPPAEVAAATSGTGTGTGGGGDDVFRRATLVWCDYAGGGDCVVSCDDGSQLQVGIHDVRLPRRESAQMFAEGTRVYGLFGDWYAGVVPSEGLAEPTIDGRYPVTLHHNGGRWGAYVSRREMVQADGGTNDFSNGVWKLRKGSPLIVKASAESYACQRRLLQPCGLDWLCRRPCPPSALTRLLSLECLLCVFE